MRRGTTTPKGRASRDTILDAAVVEFTTKGYRGSSLNSIAQRAEITKSGLLHHFEGKEALLSAVLTERTAQKRSAPIPSAAPVVPAAADLFAEMTSTVTHNQDDESWVRFFVIMVAESFTQGHPAADVIQERYRTVLATLAGRLREEHPDLDPARAERLAALTSAVMDGLQVLRLADPAFDMRQPFAEFVDAITATLSAPVLAPDAAGEASQPTEA